MRKVICDLRAERWALLAAHKFQCVFRTFIAKQWHVSRTFDTGIQISSSVFWQHLL